MWHQQPRISQTHLSNTSRDVTRTMVATIQSPRSSQFQFLTPILWNNNKRHQRRCYNNNQIITIISTISRLTKTKNSWYRLNLRWRCWRGLGWFRRSRGVWWRGRTRSCRSDLDTNIPLNSLKTALMRAECILRTCQWLASRPRSSALWSLGSSARSTTNSVQMTPPFSKAVSLSQLMRTFLAPRTPSSRGSSPRSSHSALVTRRLLRINSQASLCRTILSRPSSLMARNSSLQVVLITLFRAKLLARQRSRPRMRQESTKVEM